MRKLVFLLMILSGAYFVAPPIHACHEDLLNDMKENPDLKTAINNDPELIKAWQLLFDLGNDIDDILRKDPDVLNDINDILKNKDLKHIGIDEDTFKDIIIQKVDDEFYESDELKIMFKAMKPKNEGASLPIGKVDGYFSVLSYRYYYQHSKFKELAGIPKRNIIIDGQNRAVSPSKWENKLDYINLLSAGDGSYKTSIDLYSNRDIAFGLDEGLEDWAEDNNYLSYFSTDGTTGSGNNNFFDYGLCQNLDINSEWHEIFLQTIALIRADGRKIHFRLDGIDKNYVRIWENPDKIIRNDPNKVFTYTNFEIRQIARNKDWFENTEWYVDGSKLSDEDKLQVLKDQYGIVPLFD